MKPIGSNRTMGLATACLVNTEHRNGTAVCSLIEGHTGEHVDLGRCFAWEPSAVDENDTPLSRVIYVALGVALALSVAWMFWVATHV